MVLLCLGLVAFISRVTVVFLYTPRALVRSYAIVSSRIVHGFPLSFQQPVISSVAAPLWMEHTGSCYLLLDSDATVDDAIGKCTKFNASLVELEECDELLVVNELLHGVHLEAWVGLRRTDKDSSDDYRWLNNRGLAKKCLWKADEPNQTGPCVRLLRYPTAGVPDLGSHQLADHPCSDSYRPFCEKSSSASRSLGRRLAELPPNLSQVMMYHTSGLLACAQTCAQRSTSCYVFGYAKSTGTCSFYRLLESCANVATAQPGMTYYQITRTCT